MTVCLVKRDISSSSRSRFASLYSQEKGELTARMSISIPSWCDHDFPIVHFELNIRSGLTATTQCTHLTFYTYFATHSYADLQRL